MDNYLTTANPYESDNYWYEDWDDYDHTSDAKWDPHDLKN